MCHVTYQTDILKKNKQMLLVYHPRLMFVDVEIQMYCDLTIIKLRNSEGC